MRRDVPRRDAKSCAPTGGVGQPIRIIQTVLRDDRKLDEVKRKA